MKRFIGIVLVFVMSITLMNGQEEDGNLQGDTLYGSNCGQPHEPMVIVIPGDLILNNFVLTLKNVSLDVMGDIIGPGSIINECDKKCSTIYVQGQQQNQIDIDGCIDFTSDPLSVGQIRMLATDEYRYKKADKLLILKQSGRVVVYNLLSQVLFDEVTDSVDLSQLTAVVVIVKTEHGSLKLLR